MNLSIIRVNANMPNDIKVKVKLNPFYLECTTPYNITGTGPGDQGAYNQYYQSKFNVEPWPDFNWKPYWHFNPSALLIHFHGPKPADYLSSWEGEVNSERLFAGFLDSCKFADQTAGCQVCIFLFFFIFNDPLFF